MSGWIDEESIHSYVQMRTNKEHISTMNWIPYQKVEGRGRLDDVPGTNLSSVVAGSIDDTLVKA